MIELVSRLKKRYGLKIAVVSNESRELNAHRIGEFKLDAICRCIHFVLLCSPPQTRFGDLPAGIGRCPSAGAAKSFISKTHRFSWKSQRV